MTKELEPLTGDKEVQYQNAVEIASKLIDALKTSDLETPYLRVFKRALDAEFKKLLSIRKKVSSEAKRTSYNEKIKEYEAKIAKL